MSKAKRPPNRRPKAEPVTWDTVRRLALALPGVEAGTSYGAPAFKVKGKLLARLHPDGESLVLSVEYTAREVLMGAKPTVFYITEHYRCWPWVLVRIAKVDLDDLRQLLEEAWRRSAPRSLVTAWEGRSDR